MYPIVKSRDVIFRWSVLNVSPGICWKHRESAPGNPIEDAGSAHSTSLPVDNVSLVLYNETPEILKRTEQCFSQHQDNDEGQDRPKFSLTGSPTKSRNTEKETFPCILCTRSLHVRPMKSGRSNFRMKGNAMSLFPLTEYL